MQTTPLFLLFLAALIWCTLRKHDAASLGSSQRANPWQKLFAILAVLAAMLIILNPEFLALGLLTDASFFDLLVVLLTLQLQFITAQSWHFLSTFSSRVLRLITARLNLSIALIILAFEPLIKAISTIHKSLRMRMVVCSC